MAPEKETIMVLKVDLQCPRCCKKVKRVLCSFPQIRDQVYDEKQNIVIIKVLCCSPEKIRDKLCIKGGKSIHSIEIKEPPKPKPPQPPPKPQQDPPKPPEKPPEKPPPPPPPKPTPPPPQPTPPPPPPPPPQEPPPPPPPRPEPEPQPPPPQRPEPEPQPPPPPRPQPQPQPMPVCYPPPPGIYPVNFCCESCYRGQPGGPCYEFGRPQPIMCDPYCYSGGGWNSRPGYCLSPCGDYFSEENPQGCVVM